MKKAALSTLLGLFLVGCDISGLRGSGHIVTDQENVGPFVNVEASGAFQITWKAGAPSASLTGDENLLPYVELQVSDNELRVRTTRQLRPTQTMKLTLTSNALEAVKLSGASKLTAHDLKGPRFYLQTSGASKIEVDGAVDELVSSTSGASDLRAEYLATKRAEISVTGAGDARVAVSDSLKVSITGAGKVEYIGNPTDIERHITGAGSIRSLGGKPDFTIGKRN